MTTESQDIEMWSGDDLYQPFTITDGADTPAAIDLTGATITFSASRLKTASPITFSGTAAITKTVGDGITVTDAAAGEIQLTLDPADTADLKGAYYYEIEVTLGSGQVHTTTTGTLTINRDLIT